MVSMCTSLSNTYNHTQTSNAIQNWVGARTTPQTTCAQLIATATAFLRHHRMPNAMHSEFRCMKRHFMVSARNGPKSVEVISNLGLVLNEFHRRGAPYPSQHIVAVQLNHASSLWIVYIWWDLDWVSRRHTYTIRATTIYAVLINYIDRERSAEKTIKPTRNICHY